MSAPRRYVWLLIAAAVGAACGPEPGGNEGADRSGSAVRVERPGPRMEGMMEMMGNMPEGIPAADLPDSRSQGARLVTRYCSQCHGIPTPTRLSAEEWAPTLRRMIVRVERMSRMPMRRMRAPSSEEEVAILRYLQEHALRTAPPESLAGGDPTAQLFAEACSRCHALPDPAQYQPGEWPAVVERMRDNMRRMGVDEITDTAADQIVEFLQRRARR